jgi:2'-5' RNA ligase
MTTIRSFIAIELPVEVASTLAEVQDRLKKLVPAGTVRWTAPASIHLTLHFLGEVEAASLEPIREMMAASAAAGRPFALDLAGVGCFPNVRRPRIVWVGISGDTPALVALQQDLGERLQAGIGFKPEERPYSPHLTIGRVKNQLPPNQLSRLGQALAQVKVEWVAGLDVTGLSLMKSELKREGAVYTELTRAEL